jgi:hypothetical protein
MTINATQLWVKEYLDGLPLYGGIQPLAAYITPPDPNDDAAAGASAYVWPSRGDESRDNSGPAAGTVPRNTGPGTPSGWKSDVHSMDVWLVFFGQDDDPNSDTLFPAIVDAVKKRLRTAPDPALAVDPYTEQQSWLIDIGEKMSYEIQLRALSDQSFNRYDALVTLTITEVFQA